MQVEGSQEALNMLGKHTLRAQDLCACGMEAASASQAVPVLARPVSTVGS